MKRARWQFLRWVARRFQGLPRLERWHVVARAFSCPMEAIAAEVPPGRVLDVGCGHGLLSCLLAEDSRRRVRGIDPDPRKIASAQLLQGPRLEFASAPLADEPLGSYDAVTLVDVLYLLPREAWPSLIAALVARLRPGGRLILKEVSTRPRWKYAKGYLQELAMVRLLGRTMGSAIHLAHPGELARLLREAGLSVQVRDLGAGYTTAHLLLVGELARGP